MTDRDNWTIDAMEKYGGSFVAALGRAARHADPRNLLTIKDAFYDYWSEYERKGRQLQQEVMHSERVANEAAGRHNEEHHGTA